MSSAPSWTERARACLDHPRALDITFVLLSFLAILPLWIVKRPPLQDFPQHLAAMRVLLDHADPSYGLRGAVSIDLGRTQYLMVYLVGCVLTRLVGTLVAGKLLFSLSLVGIPWATRSLLRALGRDERAALAAFPFIYNAHVLLGFLNFVAALPLALYALAMAVRLRADPEPRPAGLRLAFLLLVLFYTHVLPFALAVFGVVLLAAGSDVRSMLRNAWPAFPAVIAAAAWSLGSPAGASTSEAIVAALTGRPMSATRFATPGETLREAPLWLTDNLPGDLDGLLLVAACLLIVGASAFVRAPLEARDLGASRYRLWLLPLGALLGAFVTPVSHDWIWPIAGRFPYLALVFAIPILPRWEARRGQLVAAALALLGVLHTSQYALAFHRFGSEECTGFDEVISTIPRGARVVGLVYQTHSEYVGRNPFMHFAAYEQAKNGGVFAYSFAETRQSPFSYTSEGGPPLLDFSLGWSPVSSSVVTLASYFDYAITRGSHPHLFGVALFYDMLARSGDWTVWRRKEEFRSGRAKPQVPADVEGTP